MAAEPAALPPHPVRGRMLRLLLRRPTPLSPEEHRVVAELALQAGGRRWRHVEELSILTLDGRGLDRALLRFAYAEPDLELVELPEIARLMDQLLREIPGAVPLLDDPAALFHREPGGRFSVEGGASIDVLPPGEDIDPSSILERPADLPEPALRPMTPAPRTEGELADLLQALARVGPQRELLRAGAGTGVRLVHRLHGLARSGVLAGASCALLAHLGRRDLVELEDLEDVAENLLQTGDLRERETARTLLSVLRRGTGYEGTDPEGAGGGMLGKDAVRALGVRLLARPSLQAEAEAEEAEEDDLLGDDLLLLDPDAEVPESPVSQAIRSLGEDPTVQAARGLPGLPGFGRRVLDHLGTDDASAAGACLLLSEGAWPATRVPGLVQVLAALAASDRGWPVRALAARALGCSGRPDVPGLLSGLLADASVEVAREAVRALGRTAGAENRRRVRSALADPRLAAHAIAALAESGDVGGFFAVEPLAAHPSAQVRRSVARHLDRIGGRRAVAVLQQLHREDDSWQVRLEAAGGLARHAPLDAVEELLAQADPDMVARVIRAIGEADRVDAFALLEHASRHVRAGVRQATAEAMGQLGLPSATDPLLELLNDTNPDVRTAAAEALSSCGDRRAVHALRRHAGRNDATGAAAGRALRGGRLLRLAPPDGRLRIRAESTELLGPEPQLRVRRAFQEAGLRAGCSERSFEVQGVVDTRDLAALQRVVIAIDRLQAEIPGLRWSVRDGLYAIRRVGSEWRLTASRGTIAREAGWFEEALPAPAERPPLIPLPAPGGGVAPLPVSVMQHVKGREQVRIQAPPESAADPDEITGDVQPVPPPPTEGPPQPPEESGEEDEDFRPTVVDLDLAAELEEEPDDIDDLAELEEDEPPEEEWIDPWDDLLTESRVEAALSLLARRGLDARGKEQLRTWLGSGLPGIQAAACRVAAVTGERGVIPQLKALLVGVEPTVQAAAAAALEVLEAPREPEPGDGKGGAP